MGEKRQRKKSEPAPIPEPTTDLQFTDKVIQSEKPAVVLVWASYSQQCSVMEKEVEHIAPHYEGKVGFFSINADKNPETFGRYGIRSVPTLLFFRDGQVVDRIVGLIPSGPLEWRIDRLLESRRGKRVVDVSGNLAKWGTPPQDAGSRPFYGQA
jgi:thioredoxin 1